MAHCTDKKKNVLDIKILVPACTQFLPLPRIFPLSWKLEPLWKVTQLLEAAFWGSGKQLWGGNPIPQLQWKLCAQPSTGCAHACFTYAYPHACTFATLMSQCKGLFTTLCWLWIALWDLFPIQMHQKRNQNAYVPDVSELGWVSLMIPGRLLEDGDPPGKAFMRKLRALSFSLLPELVPDVFSPGVDA